MTTVVQRAIHQLLAQESFYAHFILNSNIMYDRFGVATAGVAVIQGVPTFIFNTEFTAKLTEEGCKTVLKHEVLHLVLDHLVGMEKLSDNDRRLSNLATDCAINQYLTNLPEGCVTLEGLSKAVGHPLDAFETSDYYYSYLKQAQDNQTGQGTEGMETLDDHDIDAGDVGDKAVNRASVQATAKKAVQQAAGDAPQAVVNALDIAGQAALPWKQILRNFVFSRVSNKTKSTAKKVNRRFAMPVPGKKKERTMTLGVCLDSSGSISDSQYIAFLTELKSISKSVTKTYVIHADAEVQKVETLTGKTKVSATRYGNGGTAYQPAISKCKELKCDVIIYFGDFDCADVPLDPRVPFLWVGVGKQKAPADFGKVLRIPG